MRESFLASAFAHRPHDLLWVGNASALRPVEALPAWASTAWLAVAPVVVRRAPFLGDRVPVGVRGVSRSERCAAHVHAHQVIGKVTPQDIARDVSGRLALRHSRLPCLRALARLARELDEAALSWGVTGSVGFTLASGFDVLRAESDLDLLVRAVDASDAKALREIGRLAGDAESRVDVQVETPCGAFALNEWLRTGGPVLLKTAEGPVLCDDPWHAADLDAAQPGGHVTA
ncbi:MAG: malonate decarboxylase holo-ACP synthase [Pseudomonadota bacterium]|nr:malonate decarboxylase holo-ACP synthase [Pseudomonadota bacterium]